GFVQHFTSLPAIWQQRRSAGIYFSAHALYLAAYGLAFQAPPLRTQGGPCGPARPGGRPDAGDQFVQACHGLGFVLLLAAAALCLDHHHAFGRDAVVAQGQQPFFDRPGQGRVGNGEAQVDGAGYLVDVLAAGALRASGGKDHFVFWDGDGRHEHNDSPASACLAKRENTRVTYWNTLWIFCLPVATLIATNRRKTWQRQNSIMWLWVRVPRGA